VTLVIGERDLDYITLMFSMFSSPLPGVKRMTDFYTHDLNFTHLDVSERLDKRLKHSRGSSRGKASQGDTGRMGMMWEPPAALLRVALVVIIQHQQLLSSSSSADRWSSSSADRWSSSSADRWSSSSADRWSRA
jgi:hypothetical protein